MQLSQGLKNMKKRVIRRLTKKFLKGRLEIKYGCRHADYEVHNCNKGIGLKMNWHEGMLHES